MLTDLTGTRLHAESADARMVSAIMSGLGPTVGMLLPITPYAAVRFGLTVGAATGLGVLIAIGVLFTFGAYLGSISAQNWVIAGIRTGIVGVVVSVITIALPG